MKFEDEALELMAARYKELESLSMKVNAEFMEERDTDNEPLKPFDRSTMSVRVRPRGEYALTIVWVWTRFIKTTTGWLPRTQEVRKGRGPCTPRDRLMKQAKEWEEERVWAAELKLAEIRKELKVLKRIVADLRLLKKTDEKMREELADYILEPSGENSQ